MLKHFLFLFLFPVFSIAQTIAFSKPDSSDLFIQYGDEEVIKKANDLIKKPESQVFLAEFNKKFPNTFEKEIRYKQLLTANVDDWEIQLYDERKNQLNFIKNYTNLSPELQKLVESNNRWNNWHLIILYDHMLDKLDIKL